MLDSNKVAVNDVLHVPGLVANLLSVSKIIEKYNTVVFNKSDGCTVYNNDGDVVISCLPQNGVYKLQAKTEKCLISSEK